MPRNPDFAARARSILAGDFGRAPVTASTAPDPVRLHIGDSAEGPGPELPLVDELSSVGEWWYRYPAPVGTGKLRRALAGYYATTHALETTVDEILITPGATAGLNSLVHLLCDEGDEVLVPTPAWPLFSGMCKLAGAKPIELPLHHEVDELSADELAHRIESAITPRTTLLWLNTPNNPSGTLMDAEQCAAVLKVARRHDLWVISDEAYDGMAFDGRSTRTMGHHPDVIVVSTFSKMHRCAGLRLGWIRSRPEVIAAATRVATFQNYSASAAAQALVEPAVMTRADWEPGVRASLQERRDAFVAALDLDIRPPAGSYFVFLDLRRWLGPDFDGAAAVAGLLQQGVCVTAGIEFGQDFKGWIRACFASESEESTVTAARRIGAWIRDRASHDG